MMQLFSNLYFQKTAGATAEVSGKLGEDENVILEVLFIA